MKDRDEWIEEVCGYIKWKPAKAQVRDELNAHIEDQAEAFRRVGVETEKAALKAVETMGDAREVGERLNRIHRPGWDSKVVVLTILLIALGSLLLIPITAVSDVRGTEYIGMHLWNLLPAAAVFLICWRLGFPVVEKAPILSYFGFMLAVAIVKSLYIIRETMPANLFIIMISCVLFACMAEKLFRYHMIGYLILCLIWCVSVIYFTVIGGSMIESVRLFYLEGIILFVLIMKQKVSKCRKLVMTGIGIALIGVFMTFWFPQYGVSVYTQLNPLNIDLSGIRLLGRAKLAGNGAEMQSLDWREVRMLFGWEFNLLFGYILLSYGFIPMLFSIGMVLLWIFVLFRLAARIHNRMASVMGYACVLMFSFQVVRYLIGHIIWIFEAVSLPFLVYGRTAMLMNAALFGLFLSAYRYGRIREKRISGIFSRKRIQSDASL